MISFKISLNTAIFCIKARVLFQRLSYTVVFAVCVTFLAACVTPPPSPTLSLPTDSLPTDSLPTGARTNGDRQTVSGTEFPNDLSGSGQLRALNSGINGRVGQGEAAALFQPSVRGLEVVTVPIGEVLSLHPVTFESGEAGLLAVTQQGEIVLFEPSSGAIYRFAELARRTGSIAFSPKKRGLLAVSEGRSVHVYSLATLKQLYLLSRLKANVNALDFSPEGDSLLVAGADTRVYHWKFAAEAVAQTEAERDKSLERYVGHSSIVGAVRFHPFGRVFVSGDWRGGLSAWLRYDADLFGGEYDQQIFSGESLTERANRSKGARAEGAAIDRIEFEPKGEFAYIGVQDGTIEAWQIRGFRRVGWIKAAAGMFYALAINSSGSQVAAVGRDGLIRIYSVAEIRNLDDGQLEVKFTEVSNLQVEGARRLAFLGDQWIAAGAKDGEISVIQIEPQLGDG